MKVVGPSLLLGEQSLLEGVVDAQLDLQRRYVYADWLEQSGAPQRAALLRTTARLLDEVGDEKALKTLPRSVDPIWAELIGHTALSSLLEQGQPIAQCREWLSLGRPAISLAWRKAAREPAIGSSKAWGLADLEPGVRWPKVKDCIIWHGGDKLNPDATCKFVAQVNFSELTGTLSCRAFPRDGLLSFFTFNEADSVGTLATSLRFSRAGSSLERRPHPDGGELNSESPVHSLIATEFLSFPENDNSAVTLSPQARRANLRLLGDTSINGLGGYLNKTTGRDPTPKSGWVRLACLPDSPEKWAMFHLGVPEVSFARAEFEAAKLVWIDLG